MGTPDTDLGPKWMLPYHASLTTDGSGNVTIIDSDGTQRIFTKDATSNPQTYTADKESGALISDGTDFILTRFQGDKWHWDFTTKLLKKITSRTGHEISIARDAGNRITKITDGFGRDTFYFYITYGSSMHEYLTDRRVKKITLRSNTSSTKSTREYFYQDTDSSHAYVANKNKHLRKTLDKKQAGAVITSFDYELDKAGIRLSMTDKDGKYWRYGYDPLYQLKMETKWSAKVPGTREYQYAFVYDPNGNRIRQYHNGVETGYVYGLNNEMTDAGADDFTYDHFGNTKTKVSGGSTTNYIWDYESHLLSIDYPGTTNDDSHEYDGDGRRMRSKLNGASEWTNFIHDEVGGSLLAEYTLISGVYTVKALYTNGLGLISTNREGVKRYFHFDGLGSTWALTDENENVKDSYSYSAFGVTLSATSTNGPSTNPMRFVGRWGYYDDTAMGSQGGLSLLGVRYLSPSSGRFLTWDPIRSTNNYDYVRNRSTQLTDPDGRIIPILIGGALIGGVCLLIGGCSPAEPVRVAIGSRERCTETDSDFGTTGCGAMCSTASRREYRDWDLWTHECTDCCAYIHRNESDLGFDPDGFGECVRYFCVLRKNPCVCAHEME